MKKEGIIFVLAILFLLPTISALACNLGVNLINQDPYPAIPGDYVDVVFQITGIDNPDCGIVIFEVKEEFPFSFDTGTKNPITIKSGTYDRRFSSFYIAPYKIRIDESALDGDNPIEVDYSSSSKFASLKEFNIKIDDTRVDFEIFVKDYNTETRIITFEILNIGENDIEALTVEIPPQNHVQVKGADKNIVGDLDSNEYTTTDFEIAQGGGGNIDLNLFYTDAIKERRNITKTVIFDPTYFEGRASAAKTSISTYILVLLIAGYAGFWFYKRYRRNKRKHLQTR